MSIETPDIIEEEIVEEHYEVEEPKKYKVIIHNDEKTTFDFVIQLLQLVFHKQLESAVELTRMVHFTGSGVAGIYTKEVAEEKTKEGMNLARTSGFPLQLTLEEH